MLGPSLLPGSNRPIFGDGPARAAPAHLLTKSQWKMEGRGGPERLRSPTSPTNDLAGPPGTSIEPPCSLSASCCPFAASTFHRPWPPKSQQNPANVDGTKQVVSTRRKRWRSGDMRMGQAHPCPGGSPCTTDSHQGPRHPHRMLARLRAHSSAPSHGRPRRAQINGHPPTATTSTAQAVPAPRC
eukprot:SAG31_NODE_335_length_17509_cov_7.127972_18_plen_184_part_00